MKRKIDLLVIVLMVLAGSYLIYEFYTNLRIVNIEKLEAVIIEKLEIAYFEGQRDAIGGDVRIKLNSDSVYVWVKSPWDSGKAPVYNPTYLDSKYGYRSGKK